MTLINNTCMACHSLLLQLDNVAQVTIYIHRAPHGIEPLLYWGFTW